MPDLSSALTLTRDGKTLDLREGSLQDRGGNAIALRPQSLAVLVELGRAAGDVVSKDALMAAVWPGTAVTDDSLVQCVHDIRRALGDEGRDVIRTMPRRGYRLVPATPGRARRRVAWFAASAAVAVVVVSVSLSLRRPDAPPPSVLPLVAVLPFEALSDDRTVRLLATGLTEDIITDLSGFPEFGVLSLNATRPYSEGPVPSGRVRSELGARFVVEGSISGSARRVRVTSRLIDADTGTSVWSQRWDRPGPDVFAIQSEISEQIANRIGGGSGLVQQTGRIAARRKQPESLGAYELYLLGSERLEGLTQADVTAAIGLLGQAVERDPGFARAWLELYHAHDVLGQFNVEPEANQAKAEAAAARALALDPGDAEAHVVEAMSRARQGDMARAKAAFETALALAPSSAEVLTFYSAFASDFGDAQGGAEMADRARLLDPNFPTWKAKFYSYAYFVASRYEDTLDMVARLTPDTYSPRTWAMHAGSLAAVGRREEARKWVELAQAAWPGYSIETVINFPGPAEESLLLFVTAMREAGFMPCADPAFLATVSDPRRLAGCEDSTKVVEQ